MRDVFDVSIQSGSVEQGFSLMIVLKRDSGLVGSATRQRVFFPSPSFIQVRSNGSEDLSGHTWLTSGDSTYQKDAAPRNTPVAQTMK